MDVEELTKQLDTRDDEECIRWDLWRTFYREWAVKVNIGKQVEVFTGPALAPVLAEALAWKPLPVVPRNPADFLDPNSPKHVVKAPSGRGWVVRGHGWNTSPVNTKKEAEAKLEKLERMDRERCEAWIRDHGWTLTKTEGVDFRYED